VVKGEKVRVRCQDLLLEKKKTSKGIE